MQVCIAVLGSAYCGQCQSTSPTPLQVISSRTHALGWGESNCVCLISHNIMHKLRPLKQLRADHPCPLSHFKQPGIWPPRPPLTYYLNRKVIFLKIAHFPSQFAYHCKYYPQFSDWNRPPSIISVFVLFLLNLFLPQNKIIVLHCWLVHNPFNIFGLKRKTKHQSKVVKNWTYPSM